MAKNLSIASYSIEITSNNEKTKGTQKAKSFKAKDHTHFRHLFVRVCPFHQGRLQPFALVGDLSIVDIVPPFSLFLVSELATGGWLCAIVDSFSGTLTYCGLMLLLAALKPTRTLVKLMDLSVRQ